MYITIFVCCIILIVLVGIFDPFNETEAKDFIVCWIAGLIWSLLIGELLGSVIRAMLIWLAISGDFKERFSEDGCITTSARIILTYFPCVTFIQLLPTEL